VNRERDHEEAAAEAVLAELARTEGAPPPEAAAGGDDEVAEVLRRLYLEGFGLLAYEAAPVAPPAGAKERLLARVTGDETQEVEPLEAPAPAVEPVIAPPARVLPIAPRPEPAEERVVAPPPRRRRWPTALAALFALAAIGLGLWAAFLQSELAATRSLLAATQGALADSDRVRREEVAAARAESAALEERLTFVTAPALAVYTLRPPSDGRQPVARATLYVAPDRRRWRLEARGLAPEPDHQDYQLWFIVDGIPQSGGVFDAAPSRVAELADTDLPPGTTAVAITLERKGGAPGPTTPILLVADRSVQL
jgi:hypothetical protein